jgi:hypothetical protein
LEGFDPEEKPRAFVVFKSDENRQILLNAVDGKDGSALIWLRAEMDKYHQVIMVSLYLSGTKFHFWKQFLIMICGLFFFACSCSWQFN